MRRLHPLRLQYEMFADGNPFAAVVAKWADWARSNRAPVSAGNSFLASEQGASRQIVAALDAWRDLRDRSAELMFLSVYGSPLLQAAVGIDPAGTAPSRRPGKDPFHRELLRERIAELKSRISVGGLREAAARVAIYVGMACGGPDERVFAAVRRLRLAPLGAGLTLAQFKTMVREQYFMLLIDPGAALAAIPKMLPANAEARSDGLAAIFQILTAAATSWVRPQNVSHGSRGFSASRRKRSRSSVSPTGGRSVQSLVAIKNSRRRQAHAPHQGKRARTYRADRAGRRAAPQRNTSA